MEIRWLNDFQTLVEQKNFSRAAEECNVSQPAFSRRIRMLEAEVGACLINRQTLPLSLTPAGEVFLAQSKKILQTYQETLDRCQNTETASINKVRFATTQSLYLTHFEEYIKPHTSNGVLEIDLNSTSWTAEQFVSSLQQSCCDLMLTYWHPSMRHLAPLEASKAEYITIAHDRLVPVTKNNENSRVLPGVANDPIPVLGYSNLSALNPVVEQILNQNIEAPSVLTVNRNSQSIGIMAMIKRSFGIGWLPYRMCKEKIESGELALAGDARFEENIEIRLYRDSQNANAHLDNLWNTIKSATASKAENNVVAIGAR